MELGAGGGAFAVPGEGLEGSKGDSWGGGLQYFKGGKKEESAKKSRPRRRKCRERAVQMFVGIMPAETRIATAGEEESSLDRGSPSLSSAAEIVQNEDGKGPLIGHQEAIGAIPGAISVMSLWYRPEYEGWRVMDNEEMEALEFLVEEGDS